jgi:hypothetical protein
VKTLEVSRRALAADAGRLTAGNLAGLLRTAGLPCVTLTTEDGAAAEPASTVGEGLRVVEATLPVRVRYAGPPGSDAAVDRRYSHLRWLADFAEDRRWSVTWLRDGWMTILASDPDAAFAALADHWPEERPRGRPRAGRPDADAGEAPGSKRAAPTSPSR